MTETEKMQQLHLKSVQGQKLSAKDADKLKIWYKNLDHEESVINRNNRQIDVTTIRKKIEKTSQQIVVVSNEISMILKQNEQIRLENQQLRQSLESSLAEQAA